MDVLKEQDWMDETTKKAALEKAGQLKNIFQNFDPGSPLIRSFGRCLLKKLMHFTVLQIIQWFSLRVFFNRLYHPEYPDGFNYGAIGMIIGHKITHE